MVHIKHAIRELIDKHGRDIVRLKLGVTDASLSTWMHHNNAPKFSTACNIYKHYEVVIFPYSEDALDETVQASRTNIG
jgi:hypothetical protein